MNKKVKTLLAASALTFAMGTTALADNTAVTELKQSMMQIGVPSNYTANVVDYLQKVKITETQKSQAIGYVREAKDLIGETKDISKLSSEVKTKLQTLAVQAGKLLGLNVGVNKDSRSRTTVVVTTPKGEILIQLTSEEAVELVRRFDIEKIISFINQAVAFSNDSNKNGYRPEGGGQLNQTATPYGNLIVAGAGMMAMAGGIYVLSKKRKEEYV